MQNQVCRMICIRLSLGSVDVSILCTVLFATDTPGNQHAAPTQNLQLSKRLVAQDILQRHSARPHATQVPESSPAIWTSRVGQRVLPQPAQFIASQTQIATFAQQQRQQRIEAEGAPQNTRPKTRHRPLSLGATALGRGYEARSLSL